jgi:thiol-disulfide isomerase/thioredoxin
MEVKQTLFEEETFWDLVKGQNLFKANRSVHKADVVLADKKIILLYFSANWCQACTEFTPLLRDFYEDVRYRGIEVIFVSSDGCPEDMFKYMKDSHGDWFAVEYGSELARNLTRKYDVWGIQCSSGLIVLSENGSLITKNGRNAVSEKGPEVIYQWSDGMSRSNNINRYDSDDSDDESDSESDTEDLCTFTKTGTSYRRQHWYFCRTCNFEYDEGVCSICVKTCHSNHDVVYAKHSLFFCDCGAKGEKSCQKLVKTDKGIIHIKT